MKMLIALVLFPSIAAAAQNATGTPVAKTQPDQNHAECRQWVDELSHEYYQGTIDGYKRVLASNPDPTTCAAPSAVQLRTTAPAMTPYRASPTSEQRHTTCQQWVDEL